MLILAKHNWPGAITPHLWGFAMTYATMIRGSTLREGEARIPLQKFLDTDDAPDMSRVQSGPKTPERNLSTEQMERLITYWDLSGTFEGARTFGLTCTEPTNRNGVSSISHHTR